MIQNGWSYKHKVPKSHVYLFNLPGMALGKTLVSHYPEKFLMYRMLINHQNRCLQKEPKCLVISWQPVCMPSADSIILHLNYPLSLQANWLTINQLLPGNLPKHCLYNFFTITTYHKLK